MGIVKLVPEGESARGFWLLARVKLDGVHDVDNDRDQHENHIQTEAPQHHPHSWREPNPSPVDPLLCSDQLVLFEHGQNGFRPVGAVQCAGVRVRGPLGPSVVWVSLHSSHLDRWHIVNRVHLVSAKEMGKDGEDPPHQPDGDQPDRHGNGRNVRPDAVGMSANDLAVVHEQDQEE